MNFEKLNKIPEFFAAWSFRVRYFASILVWLADSFSNFPRFKNVPAKEPEQHPKPDS